MEKKRTCKIVDFAVPTDHRVKFKESEKKDKYLDLVRELKKLWKVTLIPRITLVYKEIEASTKIPVFT